MKKYPSAYWAALLMPLLLMLLPGCLLAPREQPESCFYDLAMPEKPQPQNRFRWIVFANDTPSRTRMLQRQAGNRIVQDDYNCWVQTPEKMIQRYMTLAYPADSKTPSANLADLRVTVTAFEFDTVKSEAVLSLNYTLKKGSLRYAGAITVRKKFQTAQAPAMAAAMDQAVAEATTKLYQAVCSSLERP